MLLADESEYMINKYIERGIMYILVDNGMKAICIVTDEGNHVLEIKNIAVELDSQGKGYGKLLIGFIENKYKDLYDILQVGTGDSLLTIPFYQKCGFRRSYVIKDFFVDYYDHPIYECGRQLVDMIYLRKYIGKR